MAHTLQQLGRLSVLALWAAALTVLTAILVFDMLPLPKDVAPLKSMKFAYAGSSTGAISVSLPDNWRSMPGRKLETAIYRGQFDFLADAERWAVYIPGYSGQIVVTVNGEELDSGGFFSGDLIADQSTPYFAPIPRSALERNNNQIEIRLRPGGILKGFLAPVYIGRADLLRASFDWHYLRAVHLPVFVVFWQLLLAALLFVLWFNRRRERAALFCSCLLMLSCLNVIPVYLPGSTGLADAITRFSLVTNFWLCVIGLLFTANLTNRPLPVKQRYVLLPPMLASVAFFVLPQEIYHYVNLIVVVPICLVGVAWIIYLLVRSAIWDKNRESGLILISILGASSLAVHDILILSNVIEDRNFLHFRIVYILILPALSMVFIQRLIHSMNRVDGLVGTLERRIEQKELQLRETFEQRRLLEGRQALNEERRRIMRDVHDGLGGQLMSIIAMSRLDKSDPEEIETSARVALEDLRMVIRSLDVEDDITGMLGTFRERAEQQLALQDIELEWQMIDIPAIEGLNPSGALNVLRILQETTTNAAKHSGASKVSIRFSLVTDTERRLCIEIEDNGIGLEHASTSGQGLRNIKSRAQAVNGDIVVAPSAEGTRVTFTMPIAASPDAASGDLVRSRSVSLGDAADATAATKKTSIAVLPFKNQSRDVKLEYFSDGVAEDIISGLSRVASLLVIARNSSFSYKESGMSSREIAGELGVRYVLEGKVLRSSSRLRIEARLTDATSGAEQWVESFGGALKDVFDIQEEVTLAIVSSLALNMRPQEQTFIEHRDTDSIEAYDLFLKARALWQRQTRTDNAKALKMLNRAVELDPTFARGFVYLGMALAVEGINKWSKSPGESIAKGFEKTRIARELDPHEPLAVLSMGVAYLTDGKIELAVAQAKRAIELDPNFAHAYRDLGWFLNQAGRPRQALEALQMSVQLDPSYNHLVLHLMGQAHFLLCEYDLAVDRLQRRLARYPGSDNSNAMLAASYGHLGRKEEALAAWDRVLEINPTYSLHERRKLFPYKNPYDFKSIVEGLQKAGVEVK